MIDTSPRRTRTIAVIGTRAGTSRQSSQIVSSFLRKSGYEVISVKPAQMPVVDLTSLELPGMSPGSVDAVVIVRRPDAMPVQIREVAAQEFTAVWLAEGRGAAHERPNWFLVPVGDAWFDQTARAVRIDVPARHRTPFDPDEFERMTPQQADEYERRVLAACCPEIGFHRDGRPDYERLQQFTCPVWLRPSVE